MRLVRLFALGVCLAVAVAALAAAPDGNATIRAKAGDSEIVITTTDRLAGAIHSLTWNGKEFIDSADHGRQLQSASNLDCGKRLLNETYNPTEAGSRRDGAGKTSSSRLLSLKADGADLETTTQMAFWLVPGEKSGPNPAYNDRVLSDHLLRKRVHIGSPDLPHAIEYTVTFTVPKDEQHTAAVFEALTGYMPAEFSQFLRLREGKLELLPKGEGEQEHPVVLATADDRYAMGVFAPEAVKGARGPSYGRFRFEAEKVNKWNCVYRMTEPKGIAPGDYTFRMFVAVGSRADVQATLNALRDRR